MICLLSQAPLGPWQTRRCLALVLPNPSVLNLPVHLSITCPKIMEGVRKLSPCSCGFTRVVWVKRNHSKQSQAHSATSGIGILLMWKDDLRDPASRVSGLVRAHDTSAELPALSAAVSWQSWTFPGHLLQWKTFWKVRKHSRLEETSVLCASGLWPSRRWVTLNLWSSVTSGSFYSVPLLFL